MTRILASINLRFRPSDTLERALPEHGCVCAGGARRKMRPKTARLPSAKWLSQKQTPKSQLGTQKMASSRLPSMRYASTLLITAALAAPTWTLAADTSRRTADAGDSAATAPEE